MSEQPTSDELLRCPFCAGPASHEQIGDDEFCHVVACDICAASTDHYMTKESAIEHWNTRETNHE